MIENPDDFPNQSSTNQNPSSQGKKTTSGTQKDNVEELVNQVLERKQTVQNLTQLRSRINWLTGLFAIAIIILGGGLGWVSYSLQQQKQLVKQNENPENLERIQQLDAQIKELQKQVPDPQKIQSLENQVDELNSAIDNNQQKLEQVLKENQNQGSQDKNQNQVSREDIEYNFQAE